MRLDSVGKTIDRESSSEEEGESDNDELTLEYLPNELQTVNSFQNDEADFILNGENNKNKEMMVEFFRGINLCH